MRLLYDSQNKIKRSTLSIRQMAKIRRMDAGKFKQQLSAVAEWSIPKLSPSDLKEANRKRGRKSNEEIYQEEHEQEYIQLYDGCNPTHPIQLDRLKTICQTCEDCGKTCEKGREKELKFYKKNSKVYWRQKCLVCGLFKNPYTQRFELNVNQAQSAVLSYLSDVKDSEYATFNQEIVKEDK